MLEKKLKMKKVISVNNIAETEKFAFELGKELVKDDIILFNGDLGTGKTVISKALCKYFGVSDTVISPTFNILKIYNTNHNSIKQILHFDLYRIKDENELINLGFYDYLAYEDSLILIEWPEFAYKLIDRPYYHIKIFRDNNDSNKRMIEYEKNE